MSMEDLLFGSDLEDSEDEAKAAKGNKAAEREAQLNELFGDSPSEGEEEVEHGEASESDREEVDSGDEKVKERRRSVQEKDEEDEGEGQDDDNDEENEVRTSGLHIIY